MKAEIENRPVFTTVTMKLEAGESFRAEAGAMVSMSTTVELKSKTAAKGLGGMFKAAVGGEGMFATEFTANGGAGEVVLAPPTPGDVLEISLSGGTLFAQSGAYLAGMNGLELGTKGSMKALLSGEGLFLQTISGSGTVWLSCYGAILVRELGAGETYTVDTGHMLAFEEKVTYTVKKAAKGLFSTMASGEGLVAQFKGPEKVWIQSRNLNGFAGLIAKLMPKKS